MPFPFRRVLGERPYRLGMCDVNKGQVIVDGVGSAYCTHRIKIRISPEHMSNRAARNFTMQVAFSTPRARHMTVQLTGVLCGSRLEGPIGTALFFPFRNLSPHQCSDDAGTFTSNKNFVKNTNDNK